MGYRIAAIHAINRNDRSAGRLGQHLRPSYLKFLYGILQNHYRIILEANNNNISPKFRFLLFWKNLTREIRLFMVTFFNWDISTLMIKMHKMLFNQIGRAHV